MSLEGAGIVAQSDSMVVDLRLQPCHSSRSPSVVYAAAWSPEGMPRKRSSSKAVLFFSMKKTARPNL